MAWGMRLAAKRVCYQTLWSNAMNGISSDTRVVKVMPDWQKLLYAIDAIACAAFAACLVWNGIVVFRDEKKRKAAK